MNTGIQAFLLTALDSQNISGAIVSVVIFPALTKHLLHLSFSPDNSQGSNTCVVLTHVDQVSGLSPL